MVPTGHAQITRQALGELVSARALQTILIANLRQDNLRGQVGHDEYHFDNNAFEKANAYLDEQRQLSLDALRDGQVSSAWSAFGRLTHAAQDFYAHSNYVTMWLARHTDSTPPASTEIDPVISDLINSPDLRSGKTYYPQEALYFVPGFRKLALAILPDDSHAHMNYDSPKTNPHYEYAFVAAVKRTQLEFEKLKSLLSIDSLTLFVDMGTQHAA